MSLKIKTKQDLIAYLQSLPDDWVLTKCITWRHPELVAMGVGYSDMEIHPYVEIQVDGPKFIERIDTALHG